MNLSNILLSTICSTTLMFTSCSQTDKSKNWHGKSDAVIDGHVFGHQLNPNCGKADTIESRIGCVVKKVYKGNQLKINDTLILLHYFKETYKIPDNQDYRFYLNRSKRSFDFVFEIAHFNTRLN